MSYTQIQGSQLVAIPRLFVRAAGAPAVLGAAVLLCCSVAPATAQHADTDDARASALIERWTEVDPAPWRGNFDDGAARLLEEAPGHRTAILDEILRAASHDRSRIDLSATVGPLFDVVSRDPSLERRLKAAEALQQIGADGILASLFRMAVKRVVGLFEAGGIEHCSAERRNA